MDKVNREDTVEWRRKMREDRLGKGGKVQSSHCDVREPGWEENPPPQADREPG